MKLTEVGQINPLHMGVVIIVTLASIYLTAPTVRYYFWLNRQPAMVGERPIADSNRPPETQKEELEAWKKRSGHAALPYVWNESLSKKAQKPNVVEGKGKEVQIPTPTEVACRLIASVLDSGGWATVKAAVNRHRRAARPPTGCA